jgi:hypothetical protein
MHGEETCLGADAGYVGNWPSEKSTSQITRPHGRLKWRIAKRLQTAQTNG